MSVRVLTMMRPRGRGELLPFVTNNNNNTNALREHSPSRAQQARVSVWGVRCACATAVLPVLLLGNSAASAHRAACLHLLSAPFTAPFLQRWACEADGVAAGLCRFSLFVGNLAALLLLAPSTASDTLAVFWMRAAIMTPTPNYENSNPNHNTHNNEDSSSSGGGSNHHHDAAFNHVTMQTYGGVWVPWAHALAASALCAGCAQLLYALPKDNVLRVMGCTACAVLVGALAVAAALSPAPLARRLFQSAALPFLVLFGETSRPSFSTPTAAAPAGGASSST
jgi:hypothetical protein